MDLSTKTQSTAASIAELVKLVSSLAQEVKDLKTNQSVKPSASKKAAASKITVTVAQVKALSAEDLDTLRYSLVETKGDEKVLERNSKGQKQYKLVSKADRAWYMGLKGLAATLHRGDSISETIGDGRERSQMTFAQDLLSQMTAADFIKLRQPKAASK